MRLLLTLFALTYANLWDNIITNIRAPHVFFPSEFDVLLSTNATINITNYLAVSNKFNSLHLNGQISTLDFDPETLFDVIIDFNSNSAKILQDGVCYELDLPNTNSSIRFAKAFNILPFFT